MIRHERLYNALLLVLAIAILSSVGLLACIMALPAQMRPPMRVPEWSLILTAFVNGIYLCGLLATLAWRWLQMPGEKTLTRWLNVALLLAPPLGTALGIYGLWKVDRKSPAASA